MIRVPFRGSFTPDWLPYDLISIVSVTLMVLLWDLTLRWAAPTFLPGPVDVGRGIIELAWQGRLFRHIVASLFRVTWGYLGAVAIGVPFGLALGCYPRAHQVFGPVITLARPISPFAWIPIAILWFGLGDRSAIFIILVSSLWPITTYTASAVRTVPLVYVRVGRNFGLGHRGLLRSVVLPAAWPQVLSGLRVTLGIAWVVDVAAEMLAVSSGLGFQIIDARNAGNRYDLVAACMVIVGAIGLCLDAVMRRLGRISPA